MIQLQKILVPVDFSRFSEKALNYGCELSKKFGAEIHLLNVQEETSYFLPDPGTVTVPLQEVITEQRKLAEAKLEEYPAPAVSGEIPIVRIVRMGTPFLEIIRYASENAIDLIVMGTHGRAGLAHVFLGSVAERVVRKAPCPVLTVRHPEHEFIKP